MRPLCAGVCESAQILYLYLPGIVKVSRSREINISSFLTHYTTHELIVAAALRNTLNYAI